MKPNWNVEGNKNTTNVTLEWEKDAVNLLEVASVSTIICFHFYGFVLQYNMPIT